jgi:3-oxoacyl-[acyl-carrier-protein] synthase-3
MDLVTENHQGRPYRLRASKQAGQLLRETAEPFLRRCAEGALKAAGAEPRDLDFVVVPTPNAWYPEFASRVLGVDPAKTINMHAAYANTGPVLMPSNLFHAAHEKKIKRGDLVLLYAVGSVSSAGALVVRWGDPKLGPPPEPGIPED